MDKEYKGLKENLERFKNDLTDEKTKLLFSIAYKQGYDQALNISNVVVRSEELKPKQQICYKSNEPCKYDCSGLCKESY